MNNLTLDGQFLDDLTNEQKGVLWNYYNILNAPVASIDDEVEQISSIWEKAESDPTLCKWLELIDYFYTNVPEINEKLENDRRAYYSEHLGTILEQSSTITSKKDISFLPSDVEFLVFICPDNSGCIRIPIKDTHTLAELNEQLCSQCNQKLGDHQVTYIGKANPR